MSPDAQIHDGFGRRSGVDAAEHHSSRILTLSAGALLRQEVVVFALAEVNRSFFRCLAACRMRPLLGRADEVIE